MSIFSGDVAIALTNERGIDVPADTKESRENMFRIDFVPSSVGTYIAPIYFAEQEIPNSPFKIHVEPNIEVGKIIIQGLDDRRWNPKLFRNYFSRFFLEMFDVL